MSRRGTRTVPIHRRSRSVHHVPLPYQTITETYTKETTTRPIDDCRTTTPDTAIYIPPSNRKRYPEEYPIVRIPSPYSEIYREVYDYETYSKTQQKGLTPPTYNLIPPTPTEPGIGLRKPPLPEYNEYFTSRTIHPKCDENQNPIPVPRFRSRSPLAPQKAPRGLARSTSSDTDLQQQQRYVYTHDVYVDSTTGRPFTPGREDTDKNGPKLKINVYFKPEKGVEPRYTLDEIEISKEDCGSASSRLGTFDNKPPQPYPRHSRPQSCNSLLRKESEILTVPYEVRPNQVHRESIRKESDLRTNIYRQSTRSSSEINQSEECRRSNRSFEVNQKEPIIPNRTDVIDICKPPTRTSSERTIQIDKLEESSIDMDLIFPKCLPQRPISRNVSISEKSQHSRAPTVPLAVEETLEDPIECKPPPPQKCAPREERSSSYAIDEKFDHQIPIECKPTYQKYPPGEDYHDKSTRYEKTSENYNPKPKNNTGPIEEVIHIKEKYEKDETIRRFYPTTTTV